MADSELRRLCTKLIDDDSISPGLFNLLSGIVTRLDEIEAREIQVSPERPKILFTKDMLKSQDAGIVIEPQRSALPPQEQDKLKTISPGSLGARKSYPFPKERTPDGLGEIRVGDTVETGNGNGQGPFMGLIGELKAAGIRPLGPGTDKSGVLDVPWGKNQRYTIEMMFYSSSLARVVSRGPAWDSPVQDTPPRSPEGSFIEGERDSWEIVKRDDLSVGDEVRTVYADDVDFRCEGVVTEVGVYTAIEGPRGGPYGPDSMNSNRTIYRKKKAVVAATAPDKSTEISPGAVPRAVPGVEEVPSWPRVRPGRM